MAFQNHHIFSQNVAKTDPLLGKLAENGYFDVNEDNNLIDLPATRQLAQVLGQQLGVPTGSVSPHNGGPLDSYENAQTDYLANLRAAYPTEWAAAQNNDP